MRKTRRGAAIVAVLAAVGLMTVATATPAAASVSTPKPVTTWLSSVKPHQPTWVHIFWFSTKKICDAEVTVEGKKVDISYPESTGDYSSFSDGGDLKARFVDYTAINVTAHYSKKKNVALEATISYNTCGAYASDKTKTYALTLPVVKH